MEDGGIIVKKSENVQIVDELRAQKQTFSNRSYWTFECPECTDLLSLNVNLMIEDEKGNEFWQGDCIYCEGKLYFGRPKWSIIKNG